MTRWQQFYKDDPRVLTAPASHCVYRAITFFRQYQCQIVLDLGCGVGRDTHVLASHMSLTIGVDRASAGLALTSSHQPSRTHPMAFLCADARTLPFASESFDAIYCYGLLHEFVSECAPADVQQVLHEITRLLHPGGLFVLTVLAGEPCHGLPHVRLFTPAMFTALLSGYNCLERTTYADMGCTGQTDYTIHYATCQKPEP